MGCRWASKRLVAMADDMLAEAEAEALRSHVARCADCAQRLAEVEAVRGALSALPRMTAPDDLWAGIERGIRRELVVRRRRARVRRLVPTFAPLAAAAALVLGIFVQRRGSRPPEPPVRPPRVVRIEPDTVKAIVLEHTQLANEPFVGGDDLLVAEYAFPADVVETSSPP